MGWLGWIGLGIAIFLALLVIGFFAQVYEEVKADEDEKAGRGKLRIRYTDEHGQRTQRDISIYRFGATGRKFSAYCHLRRATRDFLFSRIVEAIDLDTGEVLTKDDVARRVKKMQRMLY